MISSSAYGPTLGLEVKKNPVSIVVSGKNPRRVATKGYTKDMVKIKHRK
jgi:hypothetical protein